MFLKTSFKIYHLQGLIQDFSDEGTYPKDVDVNLLFWTIIYENEKKGLRLTPVKTKTLILFYCLLKFYAFNRFVV